MSQPLTKEQSDNLRNYLFNEDVYSIRTLAEERGKTYGSYIHNAYKGALKILYQNEDKLKLKELLGGGE